LAYLFWLTAIEPSTEQMHPEQTVKLLIAASCTKKLIGSTNNLARKDKSWNSVPDFFYKMIKGKRQGRLTGNGNNYEENDKASDTERNGQK